MKNKKILSLILGTAMIASMPLAGVKADPVAVTDGATVVGERDDIIYSGDFATGLDGTSSDTTEILAAIPEYTLTIPADTAIKRGALQANIGMATVTGNYFYKPYGVDVSISKQNFYLSKLDDDGKLLTQDADHQIKFTVQDNLGTQKTGTPGDWTGDGAYPWTDDKDINDTVQQEDPEHEGQYITVPTASSYAYHYWKNGKGSNNETDYNANKVSKINESRNVVLNIPATEWQGAVANAGIYHAQLTFKAEICTNTTKGQGHKVEVHNPNTEILPEEEVTP